MNSGTALLSGTLTTDLGEGLQRQEKEADRGGGYTTLIISQIITYWEISNLTDII